MYFRAHKKKYLGPYKSALVAAPGGYCDVLIVKLEKFTIQNVSFYGRNRKGRNRKRVKNIEYKIFFYCAFSIAAAAVASRRGCQSHAETGAAAVVFMAQ